MLCSPRILCLWRSIRRHHNIIPPLPPTFGFASHITGSAMSLLARRALRVARGFHTAASAASEALSFAQHGHVGDVLK